MSAHATHTTKRLLIALALGSAALVMTAAPATAVQLPNPAVPGTPPAAVEQGPPNYPEYDPAYKVEQGPPNYPEYDPVYDVPVPHETSSLDTTSIALGALGGIAFAGAGLGITLGLQRRRDHAVA